MHIGAILLKSKTIITEIFLFLLKTFTQLKTMWRENYWSQINGILQRKTAPQELSKTVFRFTLSFLVAENHRFIIASLAWKTLYVGANYNTKWCYWTSFIISDYEMLNCLTFCIKGELPFLNGLRLSYADFTIEE